MKITRICMGMPITVEIVDRKVRENDIEKIFTYFDYIDNTFSTYKPESEINLINRGKIKRQEWSRDMKEVFRLSQLTKEETGGYFDIARQGQYDPSGLVKGWAILNAASSLEQSGFENYYIEAGGDIQVRGRNGSGDRWRIGIRNPKNRQQIVKAVALENMGIATSGTYIRGQHIYNPHEPGRELQEIVSLTVIGPNVYEADRFATAAFAMQKKGIVFIEHLPGFEGYMIDLQGTATYTSGFTNYTTT